jgi:hypothetical protein
MGKSQNTMNELGGAVEPLLAQSNALVKETQSMIVRFATFACKT